MTLPEFARELSLQIDTTRQYVLIGVSLGGMIATEICEFMHPEKVILISSAKCRNELPKRYKFQRSFPIYKIVSGKIAKTEVTKRNRYFTGVCSGIFLVL